MIGNPLLGPLFVGRAAARWGANNQLRLPREGLLFDIPNRYPFVDRLGGDGITRITGVSAVLADTDTYALPVSWIDALGATGVDHWAFTSTGTPKEILGSVLIANGGGDQFYCGDKGLAIYSQYTPESVLVKAHKFFGYAWSVTDFDVFGDSIYTGGPLSVLAAAYIEPESNASLDLSNSFLDNTGCAHTNTTITSSAPATGVYKKLFTVGSTYTVEVLGSSDAGFTINTATFSPNSKTEVKSGFGSVTFVADKPYLYLRHGSVGSSSITKLSVREHYPSLLRSVPADIQAVDGGLFSRVSGLIVCDGNSLTAGDGSGGNTYPSQLSYRLGLSLPGVSAINNYGVSGQRTTQMIADAAAQIDPLYDGTKTVNILIAWEITNDIKYGNLSAADAYANMVSYCQSRKSAGWTVLCLTVLPRSDAGIPVDFEARRQSVNTLLRANWATICDGLIDVAADPRIGDAGDETDTTYYAADLVHLNSTGYKIVSDLIAAWVEGQSWQYPADVWAGIDLDGNVLPVQYHSEPGATELSSDGEQFNNWTAGNVVVASNTHIGPNGVLSADTVSDNGTSNIHRIRKSITGGQANVPYVLSVFGKAGDIPCIQVALIDTVTSTTASVIFDLANGVVGEVKNLNGGDGIATVISSKIESNINGFHRCTLIAKLPVVPNTRQLTLATLATGNYAPAGQVSYSGSGGGLQLFGFNFLQSDKTHSYIPSKSTNTVSEPTRSQVESAGSMRTNAIGGRLQVTPNSSGQSAWLWSSYVDADNYCGILLNATSIIYRKRVGGVNTDCSIAYTHAIDTPLRIDWYSNPLVGMGLRFSTRSGSEWSAWSGWQEITTAGGIADMQISALLEYGSLNGAYVFSGGIISHLVHWVADPRALFTALL